MSDAEEPTLAMSNIKIADYETVAYIVLAAFWFAVVYFVVYRGARVRSRRSRSAALGPRGPPGVVKRPYSVFYVNRFSMALLYGRQGA